MQWMPSTVQARTDGHTAQAKVAQCPGCGSRTFVVFLLGPRELLHFQCCGCDVTFCDGHRCNEDAP